jgi:hypothetical protein
MRRLVPNGLDDAHGVVDGKVGTGLCIENRFVPNALDGSAVD